MKNKGLGLIPSGLDMRDFLYMTANDYFPDSFSFDLSKFKVHDQGAYQNCATHALSALIEIVLKCKAISFPWYYGNRRHSDYKGEGTEIRGLLKAAQKEGGLFFESYPFEAEVSKVIENFEEKYDRFKDEAIKIRISNYYRCNSINTVKQSLLNGFPVLIGTVIFKSFYEISKENLIMPEPRITNNSLEPMAGGHMMLIVGYNSQGFKVLNSWGEDFGDNGIFIMPYSIFDWSEKHSFPIPLFDAWAIDGIISDNEDNTIKKQKDGWYKKDNKWRYRENGEDVKGWKKVNNIFYYLNKNGDMVTGWLKFDDEWYYLKENGAMKTGWLNLGGRWYYFLNSGKAVKGFYNIDGKNYYFSNEWFEDIKECQLIMTDKNGEIITP